MVDLKWNADGLIPAIIQDVQTKQVLMLAYMNEESLQKTVESKETWFYSRSRKELWHKGATSGHVQKVKKISYDCDADSLLVEVEQVGAACHTGNTSCFYRTLQEEKDYKNEDILTVLYNTILDRRANPIEGSYTNYLFEKGIDKILKKVGEESAEVIIAAKNHSRSEIVYEISDLVYHALVLMVQEDINPSEIKVELQSRHK